MANNNSEKLFEARLKKLENDQIKLQQEFASSRFFEAQKKPDLESSKPRSQYENREIEALKQKIEQIQAQINQPIQFPADAYPHLLAEPQLPLLDLPISKIIDFYHETPQILEVYCQRVSLVSDQDNILEKNGVGNFWVLQLKDQGFYLLPRPESFSRFNALPSFNKLFNPTNEKPSNNHQFTLVAPAKLDLLKIGEKWLLTKPGKILFGQPPLGYQWQQELDTIRQQYAEFNQHLATFGNSALEFTITAQYWQQSLTKKYGDLISIALNTCMPIAYAVYKGPMLVPCQIFTGSNPRVLPGWDRGIAWDASIYARFHSKRDKDLLRTPANHPFLPNQIYLREINWETNHTWAIAKSYDEATTILQKLNGNWGSLEYSTSLIEVIEQFNKGNREYFLNEAFFFLKPTSTTSLGLEGINMNATSIVDFEEVTENTSKSYYIGFNLENKKTYLIPNILNARWKQVVFNDENRIFNISGSKSHEFILHEFILVEPAEIQNIGSALWRLEKSAKFQ